MKKILIIEDEAIVAENIAAILENAGYVITGIAERADDALTALEKEKPNLIICDIFIKGSINGIELATTFSKTESIPFIYLTAFADEETIKKASQTHPMAYLVKPFTEKQLVAAVNLAMETHYGDNSAQRENNIPRPTLREIEILSFLAKGYSSKRIAEELSLSEHTIQTQRKNMMQKYKTSSSPELIALATKYKWIKT